MPTTVFFASNRILTGDPAVVTSYGPNIQPPSVSTDIMYATAFVDGVNIEADQPGSITSIQDTNKGAFAANVASALSGRNLLVFIHGSTTPSKMRSRALRLTGSSSRHPGSQGP